MQWAELQLRCSDIDRLAPRTSRQAHLLSAHELVRAGRFCFETERLRFITRRVLLRELLSEYLGYDASLVTIVEGHNGKPELGNDHHADDVAFNCSHSRGLALFGLTRGTRVGVDLERIRPLTHLDEMARSYFLPPERRALGQCAPGARNELFLRCWTMKEAFLKATGEGLARDPATVALQFGVDGLPGVHAVDGMVVTTQWFSLSFSPAPGAVAAVVLQLR